MRCPAVCAALSLALLSVVGCGKPAADAPSAGADARASASLSPSADASNPTAAPIAATRTFLEAVRRGETDKAAGMLTPLALQMTTQNDLSFSPPGSATAQFSIVAAEMVETDKAVVETEWSDLDADGNRVNETIAWALRLSDRGWRISGMAAELGEDQPPLVIDFENPADLAPTPKPQTANQPAAPPQAKNPADQVARDPFQAPTTR